METEKNRIAFLSFLRVFGVLFVVFYHSLCSYGQWKIITVEGFSLPNGLLNIMAPFVAMMPLLTFLSGYLFSYLSVKGKYDDFIGLAKNKFSRLIIPMLIFGLIPSILTYIEDKDVFSFFDYWFNGPEHLWYLSMLFWCFLAAYPLIKINNSYFHLLILAISFGFIYADFPNHLGLKYFATLFFYFYAGHIVNYYWTSIVLLFNKKRIIFLFVLFSISFFIVVLNSFHLIIEKDIAGKLLLAILNNFIRFSFLLLSVLVVYKLDNAGYLKYNKTLETIDNCSFGIYIFHAFLIPVFFVSPLLDIAIKYNIVYPFFVFIIVLSVSFYLTVIFRKTKIGRSILG